MVSQAVVSLGVPLLFGSLIVASCAAAITYPAMLWLLRRLNLAVDEETLQPPSGEVSPAHLREKQALRA